MTEDDLRWLRAVLAAETSWSWLYDNREGRKPSDTKPLAALLRSDDPLNKQDRERIADLLERHQLQKLPKGQREPMHTPSEADTMLELAEERYKKLKAADIYSEKLQDELIDETLSTLGESGFTLADCVDSETFKKTFKNHLKGKRASSRRKQKRRPA